MFTNSVFTEVFHIHTFVSIQISLSVFLGYRVEEQVRMKPNITSAPDANFADSEEKWSGNDRAVVHLPSDNISQRHSSHDYVSPDHFS